MLNLKNQLFVLIASSAIVASSQATAHSICVSTSVAKLERQTSAPDLRRSNVPTCDGRFVSGFQIIGNGVKWYADAVHADECFNVDVEFLPPDVSAYDMDSVTDFLGFEVDVYRRVERICSV